jgi:uncharacterized membrane protein
MSWFRRNWIYIAATLAIAVAVHVASVLAIPHLIMARVMGAIAQRGQINAMEFAQRPTAESRGVVRPSPDLLYSTCVFDLDKAGGALRVHAQGMPQTYWSVSAFDAETNNFFVENDRQAKTGAVDFVIAAPGVYINTRLPVVASPTARGLVLFRTLISDETQLAEIDRARRGAGCEAFPRQGN